MKIIPSLFNISFPIKIFKRKKVHFKNKKFREQLFKRNMYFYLYNKRLNLLLEKRSKIFLNLASEVECYMKKKFPELEVLNISIFGSSLYSVNNGDYDFLVIVKGNAFDNIQTEVCLFNRIYSVGISIKGFENFTNGVLNNNQNFSRDLQNKIINRTAVSLPIRHLPLKGFDFRENNDLFLRNCYAQAYDLLINSYELYYLKSKNRKISPEIRAKKLISRIFEASRYLSFVSPSKRLDGINKKIYYLKLQKFNLKDGKKIFLEFVKYYNQLVRKN
jgi:hypothetical protein